MSHDHDCSNFATITASKYPSRCATPRPRRFEFVRNAELRPVLEQAFDDSRGAFERGEFALALVLSCSVLESLLTDALSAGSGQRAAGSATTDDRRGGPSRLRLSASARPAVARSAEAAGPPSFEQRIALAEETGIIRSGCARLPPVARLPRSQR